MNAANLFGQDEMTSKMMGWGVGASSTWMKIKNKFEGMFLKTETSPLEKLMTEWEFHKGHEMLRVKKNSHNLKEK